MHLRKLITEANKNKLSNFRPTFSIDTNVNSSNTKQLVEIMLINNWKLIKYNSKEVLNYNKEELEYYNNFLRYFRIILLSQNYI